MTAPILQIDAFTSQPFAGNPAAVCILGAQVDGAWMQRVAREMNLSETAFLRRQEEGFELRWFTPAVEVDLCGHATLATAKAISRSAAGAPNSQPSSRLTIPPPDPGSAARAAPCRS